MKRIVNRAGVNAQGGEFVREDREPISGHIVRPWELVAAAILVLSLYVGGVYAIANSCAYEEVC